MNIIELTADLRTTRGNSPARALRRSGRIPAVLYGPNMAPLTLSVDATEMEKALKKAGGRQPLFKIAVAGDEKPARTVMIKELQSHPLSKSLVHADFYEVAMDRKLRVMVPVITRGHSIGVEMGGMLQVIRRELEVLCLPMQIPEVIELDTTELDIGDAIHVEDIQLEGDVEIPHDVNFTVVTVLSSRKDEIDDEDEDEGVEGEEAVSEDGAEVEAEA
ncbi:MAG: 50S ribosomal protein L25 [Desulfobacterales bacterium]|nr:50S ribosomal protein L25 [Desulfobacterales bacterium]